MYECVFVCARAEVDNNAGKLRALNERQQSEVDYNSIDEDCARNEQETTQNSGESVRGSERS